MAPTLRCRIATTSSAASSLAAERLYGPTFNAYYLKQSLVAAGWTVYLSATGAAMDSSDLWTSNAFCAMGFQADTASASTGTTVDGVWCCLRSPTADSNGDYLHICLQPGQGVWASGKSKGSTNALSIYGQYAKIGARAGSSPCYYGYPSGSLRIGMALSPLTAAFVGGYTNSSASSAIPGNGQAPATAAGFEVWAIMPLGSGIVEGGHYSGGQMSIVTDGNQFSILQTSSNSTAYKGSRFHIGAVCALQNGGYGFIQSQMNSDGAWDAYGQLVGGRYWNAGRDYANNNAYLNGPRYPFPIYGCYDHSVYIKRLSSSSIISGALACPEPAGWDSWCLSQYIAGTLPLARLSYLYALSASDPDNFDLGPFSDFVMLTSLPAVHYTMLNYDGASWLPLELRNFVCLKWPTTDTPSNFTVVTP
jgi:hypothetical protein